jgi:uncharacterized membrane-anchored protein
LGAVVGDFFDKPAEEGGLELNRFLASGLLLGVIVALMLIVRHKPASEAH